ncbi:MAG: hypothetical protein JSS27_12220 [Planctomycetes bacterium]|nr:hypothetical protein [Planctomycetota bacterium]
MVTRPFRLTNKCIIYDIVISESARDTRCLGAMMNSPAFAALLNARRKLLRMSVRSIAELSGVSTATVNRLLGGQFDRTEFRHVVAVAATLGIEFEPRVQDAKLVTTRQARRKAQKLVALVQGSSALEQQAVDRRAYAKMLKRTETELLNGSRKQLWSR